MQTTHPTIQTFVKVWGALMVLLVLTIFIAHFDLGAASLPIAIAIAVSKAVLIILFFMHVRYNSHNVLVFACAAYLWLMILIIGTLHDYLSRNWVPAASSPRGVHAGRNSNP